MPASKILSNLNRIPMFKMSLGSKELFHSNFLEYLWGVDSDSFKRMICDLLGDYKVFKSGIEYKLSREKENFDLCIYHEIGSKLEYDVIIENKVKSIPSKQQLDCYVKKVKGGNPRLLLLSLIENFFDRLDIANQTPWKIVHYDALCTAIENNYKNVNSNDATYISDYCSFISNMHSLQQQIVPVNFINEALWPDYQLYKQYRLHDLYIKLRGLKFIELLQAKLCSAGLSHEIVPVGGFKFRQSWNSKQSKDVYLNWNVFRAVGQVAAYLYNGGVRIYEIVIQGDQYRHGINYYDLKNTNISLQDIWKKVKNDDFMKGITYAGRKNKGHGQYEPDYVYVYERIQGTKISNLLDRMVNDILKQKNANRISKASLNRFEIEYKSDSSEELVCLLCSKEVGKIVNRSDLQNILEYDEIGGLDKIIKITIPSSVSCINPGAFVDCVNLQKVEIEGKYDDIECFERAGNWSVTIPINSLVSLVEQLKEGRSRIEIRRPTEGRSWTDWN